MFRKFDAYKLYLGLQFFTGLFFSMIFVVASLYEATVAGLTGTQLVLVGTTLELTVLLFEVPTGIVADAYSRRLSIIFGYLLMGLAFLVEGYFPVFSMILLTQVLWGIGYTFTSGATQAWLSDEIGEENANRAFLPRQPVRPGWCPDRHAPGHPAWEYRCERSHPGWGCSRCQYWPVPAAIYARKRFQACPPGGSQFLPTHGGYFQKGHLCDSFAAGAAVCSGNRVHLRAVF